MRTCLKIYNDMIEDVWLKVYVITALCWVKVEMYLYKATFAFTTMGYNIT